MIVAAMVLMTGFLACSPFPRSRSLLHLDQAEGNEVNSIIRSGDIKQLKRLDLQLLTFSPHLTL